jgi:RimJ/RimL family protein N-acetyltransferase
MHAPTLKTPNLILAEPIIHRGMDMTHYVEWLNNPMVVRYSEQRHRTHTRESQYRYLEAYVHNDDMYWDIRITGYPIGAITAILDHDNLVANVGIIIGDMRYWGRGYACEAYGAVCEYLFSEKYRRIEAGTMACNEAMIRVLDKLEFKREAVIKDHFLLKSKPQDLYVYAKTRKAKVVPIRSGQKEPQSPE